MTPERCRQVESLFSAAVRLDPERRGLFLTEIRANDKQLRADVESLLAADGGVGDFLQASAVEAFAELVGDDHPILQEGTKVGGYRIVRVLATGGMGTVYEAIQDRPNRTVALKLLHAGLGSRGAIRRFQYESQVLGRLKHPSIAQVYEAGTFLLGTVSIPYFSMEYLPGAQSITKYAVSCHLSLRRRLDLFLAVCDAVHHGHEHGVIHRDLKPENILVDRVGHAKVIDFGVARSTNRDVTAISSRTTRGVIVGTLQYMSPEQCDGDPNELDIRADVYSLWMVLYHLLCGQVPYDVTGSTITGAVKIIQEVEPRRPSAIRRELRGDVETIMLKALEKDRARRYTSSADLRRDIERFLANRPIDARPPTALYVTRMFARRNRALVAASACVVSILVGAVIVSTLFAVRSERQRKIAVHERHTALRQRAASRRHLYAARMNLAQQAWRQGDVA